MPKSKRTKRSNWRHRPAWRYFHKAKRVAFKLFAAFQSQVADELDKELAGRVDVREHADGCSCCDAEPRHGMIFWWLESPGEYGAKEYDPVCAKCGHDQIHYYDDWDACLANDCHCQFVNKDDGKGGKRRETCPKCGSEKLVSKVEVGTLT